MPKKYALVIGIENYPEKSGQGKVPFAAADCRAVAGYLEKHAGFDIDALLLDEKAGYKQIVGALENLFHFVEPDDWVAIYYAGHGHYSDYGGFLVPYTYEEGEPFNVSTCVSFQTVRTYLENKKPKRFLFLLDTCHSGLASMEIGLRKGDAGNERAIGIVAKKIEEELAGMVKGANVSRVLFTSCGATEMSHSDETFGHGVFTHFLLQGLAGGCPSENGLVDMEMLIPWVKDRVVKYAKEKGLRQRPSAKTQIDFPMRLPVLPSSERESIPDFQSADAELDAAEKMVAEKRFPEAVLVLRKISENDPLNWRATQLLQSAEEKWKQFRIEEEEKKRHAFREWIERSENFLTESDFDKARLCWEEATGLYPDDPRLAGLRERIEFHREEIKDDLALRLRRLFDKAEEFEKENRYHEALKIYDAIEELYPGNKKARKPRSKALQEHARDRIASLAESKKNELEEAESKNKEWIDRLAKTIENFQSVGMEKEAAEARRQIRAARERLLAFESEKKKLARLVGPQRNWNGLAKLRFFVSGCDQFGELEPFLLDQRGAAKVAFWKAFAGKTLHYSMAFVFFFSIGFFVVFSLSVLLFLIVAMFGQVAGLEIEKIVPLLVSIMLFFSLAAGLAFSVYSVAKDIKWRYFSDR